MVYRIWIGVTKDGNVLIGAKNVNRERDRDNLACAEQIYGIQFPHRVIAENVHGNYIICTPTRCREDIHLTFHKHF